MQNLPRKRIAGFVLRFALAYGALVLAWPLLAPAYRPLYCFQGNLLFQGDARAQFQARGEDELDIQIRLTSPKRPGSQGVMRNDSRYVGYLPTISLIALILATPIPWKRRRKALLAGLLLVSVFVSLRMALPVVREFSKESALQIYELGGFGTWVLGVAQRSLLRAPASWFVVPILIWIVVAFRRQDWELLEEGDEASED